MKRLVIAVVLILIGYGVNAQPYQSLFGSNSTAWKITWQNLGPIGTDSLRTGGDTIFNGLQYKKIIGELAIAGDTLVGLLREDTLTGKAWFCSTIQSNNIETLIMNLSLNVGDSIHVGYCPDTCFVFVDSVYFSSGKKHVRLNTTVNQYGWGGFGEKLLFMEGIGTNKGIQYLDPYSLNASPYLLCSYKDSQLVYTNTNPNFNQCDLLTLISEKEDSKPMALFIPNPLSDKSVLKFSNPTHSKFILYITDLMGKRIKEYNTTSDSFEINRMDLNQGIFMYNLFDIYNNTSVNNKFIVY